jgi:surfactin synthase thioesterase subunit
MANIFRRFSQAMAVLDLLAIQLPGYMDDGEITVDEMAELIKALSKILSIRLKINVPAHLSGAKLSIG